MPSPQEHQVETLRKAIDLTAAVQLCEANLGLLDEMTFGPPPALERAFSSSPPPKPQRRVLPKPPTLQPAIPAPPTTNYSYGSYLVGHAMPLVICAAAVVLAQVGLFFNPTSFALGWLSLAGEVGVFAYLVYSYFAFRKTKAQINADYANSPAYRQMVAQAMQEAEVRQQALGDEVARQQALLDEEHHAAMRRYETELVPAYERKRARELEEYEALKREYEADKLQWEQKKDHARDLLNADLQQNRAALEDLYDSSKLVSIHYRELWMLQWLYDDMSTSDHDIRYATELLDRERQRMATEQAAAKEVEAIEGLASSVGQLAGVQLQGLAYLGGLVSDIRTLGEKSYKINEKILFHQRVNTLDIAVDIWQRHKAR